MFSSWMNFAMYLLGVYALVGVIFTVAFHFSIMKSFDHAAASGNWVFRMLISPGLIALWPLMVEKALKSRSKNYAIPSPEKTVSARELRRNHGWAFIGLALLMPGLMAICFELRPNPVSSVLPKDVFQPATLKTSGQNARSSSDGPGRNEFRLGKAAINCAHSKVDCYWAA